MENNKAGQEDSGKSVINYRVLVLVLLVVLGAVAMYFATQYDQEGTVLIRQHKVQWRWFKDLMADSLFEAEKPGGGDLGIIFLILTGVFYALSWLLEVKIAFVREKLKFLYDFLAKRPNFSEKLKHYRPYLGFIVTSAFCGALYVVHTTKWIIARARPKLVFRGDLPYSEWYEYGGHFIANGVFRGSFPSGHTAAVFTIMAFAYVLINGAKKWKWKLLGFGIMLFTLALAVSMGIARAMSAAHWITDSTFIIFMNWIVIHVLYFWGLRVPEQVKYYEEQHQPCPLIPFYEILVSFYLFLLCLGIMGFFIGIRAVLINNCPWLIILTPFGFIGGLFVLYKVKKLNFFSPRLIAREKEPVSES